MAEQQRFSFFFYSLSDLSFWAERFAVLLEPPLFIALWGDLGAGKTALSRSLLQNLPNWQGQSSASEEVPSPTFTLVQSYERIVQSQKIFIHHVDLYRLNDPEELWELGLEGEEKAISLVEWPERMGTTLPDKRLDLSLSFLSEDSSILQNGDAEEGRRLTVGLSDALCRENTDLKQGWGSLKTQQSLQELEKRFPQKIPKKTEEKTEEKSKQKRQGE